MGSYIYYKDDSSCLGKYKVVNPAELPQAGVVTVEQFAKNTGMDFKIIVIIENVEFHDDKPIITTMEKAKVIFENFIICVRSYYVDPNAIDMEFMKWFSEEYPNDILSLPLDKIDHRVAKWGLANALNRLTSREYSSQWFDIIFENMPSQFKNDEMRNPADLLANFF